MNLYEVIRWGNDSKDIYTGGANGLDTCFLVRAATHEAAAKLVDEILARTPCEFVRNYAEVIHLLGEDLGSADKPRVCRGPYIENVHNFGGWKTWHRDSLAEPWYELIPSKPRRRSHKTTE